MTKKIIPTLLLLMLLFVLLFSTVKTFKKSSPDWEYFVILFNIRPWQLSYDQKLDPVIPLNTAEALKPGLKEYDSSGQVSLEIVESQAYPREKGNATAVALVKIYGYRNQTTHEFIYKGQSVKINSPLELNFPNITVPAQIVESVTNLSKMSNERYLTKLIPLTLTIRVYSVPDWKRIEINPGDTVVDAINNQPIATIKKVTRIASNRYIYFNPSQITTNRFMFEDSEIADLDIVVDLEASQRGGRYYFEYNQLLNIGNNLQLTTQNVGNIAGEIKAINENNRPNP